MPVPIPVVVALAVLGAKVDHTPPSEAVRGQVIELRARFADGSVVLLYRADAETPYTVVSCELKGDDWGCEVPAAAVAGSRFEYFIAGLNAARRPIALSGGPDAPHRVAVVDTPTVVVTPDKEPTKEPTVEPAIEPVTRQPQKPRREPKPAPSRFEPSVSKTTIDRETIRLWGAATLPELLARAAGVDAFVKTRAEQGVGIRGSARNRTTSVLVMVDGQPVNAAHHGAANWAAIPVALVDIERIEVLRGPLSYQLGEGATAGAIDIITRAPGSGGSEFEATYGERGTQNYRLRSSYGLGDARLSASVGWKKTENAQRFKAKEDQYTDYTIQNGDRKDWFEAPNATLRLDATLGGGSSLEVFGAVSEGRGGENALAGDFSVDDARVFTALERVTYRLKIARGLTFKATEALNVLNQEDTKVTTSGTMETQTQRFAIHGRRFDLDVGVTWVSGGNIFLGGLVLGVRSVESVGDRSAFSGGDSDTAFDGGAYLRDVFSLAKWLEISAGVRLEAFGDIGFQFAPRLAVSLLSGDHRLTLSGGLAFRRPSVFEQRYAETWSTNTVLAGNGSLTPEKALGVDASYQVTGLGGHTVATSFFAESVTDGIEAETTATNGVATTTYVNRAKYDQMGGELEIDGRPADWIRYFVNGSVFFGRATQSLLSGTDVVSLKHTNRRAPNYKANIGLVLTWAPYLTFGVNARYVHSFANYDELVQTLWTNDYRLEASYSTAAWVQLDSVLVGRIGKHVELGVTAMNLLNRRHYDYPIYTMLARKVLFSLRLLY